MPSSTSQFGPIEWTTLPTADVNLPRTGWQISIDSATSSHHIGMHVGDSWTYATIDSSKMPNRDMIMEAQEQLMLSHILRKRNPDEINIYGLLVTFLWYPS